MKYSSQALLNKLPILAKDELEYKINKICVSYEPTWKKSIPQIERKQYVF